MPSFSQDIRTIPNLLTVSRIVILCAGVSLYFAGWPGVALVVGIIAGITDYLDGIIARRTGQVTYLGAILDQFSDLVLEAVCLLMLIEHPLGPHPLCLVVYFLREFWVGTIRRFMAAHQIDIQSNIFGKLKTNFICWGLVPWFLYVGDLIPFLTPFAYWLAQVGLYGGLAFGVWSAWLYTRQFVAGYNRMAA